MPRRLELLAQRAAHDQRIEQLLLLRRGFVKAGQQQPGWARDSGRVNILTNDVGQPRLIGGMRCLYPSVVLAGPIHEHSRVGHRGIASHARCDVPLVHKRPRFGRQSRACL